MIYSQIPALSLIAASAGGAISAIILCTLAIGLLAGMRKRTALWLAAAGIVLLAAGIWGTTSALDFRSAEGTETIAHFEDYGFQLTDEEAAQIRVNRDDDHTMYLDTAEGVAEVLFRNVDGAVVPHTVDDTGVWIPLESAG